MAKKDLVNAEYWYELDSDDPNHLSAYEEALEKYKNACEKYRKATGRNIFQLN